MHIPKLKDKIYGGMLWEEWDEDEAYRYAPMKIGSGRQFSLLVRADSPTDFMTVGGTHSTYQRLLENVNSIRDEMVNEIMENSRKLFKKKRQKLSAGENLKKSLQLFSIKIFSDLSSTIDFIGDIPEDEDIEETLYAVLDAKGELVEAGISEL